MSDDSSLARRNLAAVLVGAVACFQMIGHFIGSTPMRCIGAATTIAPYTKVFSDVDGYEPFTSEFTLRYRDAGGVFVETSITPAMASRFGGPYNRRNMYGAALSYAPRLPEALWQPVFCHGLVNGPLREELGLGGTRDVSVTIRTRTAGRTGTWRLEPQCSL